MATIWQALKRKPKKKASSQGGTSILKKRPFVKGICERIFTIRPKKPNSANRAVAKVRLKSGQVILASIGGEGHTLQDHRTVLVRGGRSKDLPAVHYKLVRGAYDLGKVPNRRRGRSKYGTPKPRKEAVDN